jgi:NAD(P)-dependent dehydrogenase (short-subunit alcohol dehydrogenase family)
MVDSAADRLGGLGVLVNNAGVFKPHPITETSYEEWQQAWQETLGVNLVGAANVSWCAAQHMVRGGGGRSSMLRLAARFAASRDSRRTALARLGLIALGQSLARALGPHGISVTSVAPGLVETDMALENLAGDRGAQRRAESPLGRIATAEEVAAAVVFLASADAAMTSGAVLDINGASYLRM